VLAASCSAGIFFGAKYSGHDVVATVTHVGPCSNGTCTVDVVYDAAGGQVSAVMYGVNSGEIYGFPSRRLLNITYQSGYETSPTTNDMPDGIWIGFGAAGLAFVGWGAGRLRRKPSPRKLTGAAAGGVHASAAVTAVLTSAVADQPAPGGPSRTSGRGPRWVAGTSGAITIAERYPRWSAVIFTPVAAVLPGLMLMQNSRTLLPRGHALAAVAYLAIAAAVSIWGCSRGWRMGLRLSAGGVTVRNYCRTYRIGWPEVRCFADGSVNGGQSGRLWALGIVLRDGRVVTASGTARGKRDARPETLTAIRRAAERYAIPAELTGTATKRGSRETPANPGLYPDPGGHPGLRRWNGKQWSPFLLRADPASGKPTATKAPAEVWSPLAGSEPQWHDAANRARRAGIVFAAWLGVTVIAAAVTVALYARDLSKPQADFSLAVFALIAAMFALIATCSAWARRNNLKKIDKAGKAVAVLADSGDSTASRMKCPECGAQTADVTQFCVVCEAPLVTANPVAGGPGDHVQTVPALAKGAGEPPARARRDQRYLIISLVFCLFLYMIGVIGLNETPQHRGLHATTGWITVVGLAGALLSMVLLESARGQFRARQLGWASAPILSLGLLAFMPFLWLALIRRRPRDWVVFAAYLAAGSALAAFAVTYALAGHYDQGGTAWTDGVVTLAALMVIAPAHALVAFSPAAGPASWRDAHTAKVADKLQEPGEISVQNH
jgi:hypothetical protein